MGVVTRGEVHLISLDPTRGREVRKARPCLIVSPDEMNRHLGTVIVAPMTTRGQAYPSRVPCKFAGRNGQVVVDQIRAVDRARLVRRLGRVSSATLRLVLDVLQETFAP